MINGTYGQIHGISISVSDPDIVSTAINRAVAAGIPVITFDSDAEDSDRMAYVGTDNVAFGVELGKLLDQLAPQGGKYGVLSSSAPNVVQRFDGVTKRLADDSNWTPIQDSYKDCNDDIATALKIMYEFADMGVQAIIPVGGWPMWDKEGWKEFFNSNKDKNLTLIVGDTLEVQMQLMNEGYANGLVAFLEVLRYPLVLPKLEVDDNYIERLAIFGYVIFALIAVASLSLMVWTYLHKNTRVIKASQPFFLQMIIVGIIIFSSAIVPLTIDTDRYSQEASDIACMTVPWLLTIGFTTTVSVFQMYT
ncbi:hypothetical protein ACHAW5_010535 [Stephanodiscus triporus]|uniref:Periplasmic binding protein domain-containing protein n=1 Tax=Stephanodiscus triporus TaxID=2934178 RepID=A0ABD3P563_9STRA